MLLLYLINQYVYMDEFVAGGDPLMEMTLSTQHLFACLKITIQ